DFYIPQHFEAAELYYEIEKIFGEASEKTLDEEDTLFCTVEETDLSFFWYQHPLIKKTREYKGVALACLEDIAAMKLIAISRRPAKRDYIDIFFLLKIFSVEEMFSFASKKYPNINLYYSIRALSYFDDIKESDKRPVKVFDKDFSWASAKRKILQEVRKYQLAMIKKR
ncbi:MAG: nucleotidyl transferase AbiEii/AbiGii toxin family protein, partial [Patescibacteria group bacterium]